MDNGFTDQSTPKANRTVVRTLRFVALVGVALMVIAANIIVFRQIDEQMMRAIFRYFDCDNSGSISNHDLKLAFAKTGKMIDSQEVKSIMELYCEPT